MHIETLNINDLYIYTGDRGYNLNDSEPSLNSILTVKN